MNIVVPATENPVGSTFPVTSCTTTNKYSMMKTVGKGRRIVASDFGTNCMIWVKVEK